MTEAEPRGSSRRREKCQHSQISRGAKSLQAASLECDVRFGNTDTDTHTHTHTHINWICFISGALTFSATSALKHFTAPDSTTKIFIWSSFSTSSSPAVKVTTQPDLYKICCSYFSQPSIQCKISLTPASRRSKKSTAVFLQCLRCQLLYSVPGVCRARP